jgi:hypothetical protein
LSADGGQPRDERKSSRHRWWLWTAIAGATALAAGAAVYYATGDGRTVAPSGTVGTLDLRH